jgi:hypothetical protein
MCRHSWSAAQCAEVQARLARIDAIGEWIESFSAMRAFEAANIEQQVNNREGFVRSWKNIMPGSNNEMLTKYARYAPAGWFFQNELVLDHRIDHVVSELRRAKETGVCAPIQWQQPDETKLFTVLIDWPHDLFNTAITQIPISITQVQLAHTACALERFHIEQGQYPESLAALVPKLLPRVPQDLMDGKLLRYRRLNEHSFLLYSVGLNGTDDGSSFPPQGDVSRGDVVWRVP